jgi:2-amino-4-hydroxy-6-hydroxymethyldihydropteridine diphosphokinase
VKVYLALGSNLGDRLANLRAACAELQALSRAPLRKSRVYETTPVDCPPGSPKFLNAVVELEVDDHVSPHELLRTLKAIEVKLGRHPKQAHNEPRSVDLDLIQCGDRQVNTRDLVIPHPRAHLRRFVLRPLCDLSPDLVLAGQTETVRQLLAALPLAESVTAFADTW